MQVPSQMVGDERTLLKVTLAGASAASQETYQVSLKNPDGTHQFAVKLDQDRPAYFQLS